MVPTSEVRPRALRMAEKQSSFSIDDFIGEIEKAEDDRVNKRLPQERLKNKRALDNAARRAAEAAGGPGKLVPQPVVPSPLRGEGGAKRRVRGSQSDTLAAAEADGLIVDKGKGKRSAATGMSLKAPKSKANSVERPTNLEGFGESEQAGFGHVPSGRTRSPVKTPGSGSGRKVKLPGQDLSNAQTVGISATVKALEDIILHGRKEVEGNTSWMPHRPAPRQKSEGGIPFKLVSPLEPRGDQPTAIAELVEGVGNGETDQVLLGVTGSGKTYTMAQTIMRTQRPALILAPNKTLAAQLYGEFKSFFPDNAVEYFVSYYDYYQPEAYVPRTDTYIEKESTINEQIDRMRHSATRAIIERRDVIIVASVSCIYGIGDVETYSEMTVVLEQGARVDRQTLLAKLVELQYKRNDANFFRGTFRVRGDTVEIFPAHYEDRAWRLSLFGDELEAIHEFDPLTGEKTIALDAIKIYPNSHYVTPKPTLNQAIENIKADLKLRLVEFRADGKLLEAQRLEQRTQFDIEMLAATGVCAGIENYSRYLTGRAPGEPPPTLIEYLPEDALIFVDESHVTIPQLGAMYKGDYARKLTLSEYGFRLPSCMDNRPLKFEEWDAMRGQIVCVSATPGAWELNRTGGVFVEQVVRPTGLIDPVCLVRPVESQVDDLMAECKECARQGQRVLVTTLTKKMAEALTEYFHENG